MPYKIKTWIPCEEEQITVYGSEREANITAASMSAMQPENMYEVVECDELGEDAE